MSHAIFDLHLEEPPATIHREGFGFYIRCEMCGRRSKRAARIGELLPLQAMHVERHDELGRQELVAVGLAVAV